MMVSPQLLARAVNVGCDDMLFVHPDRMCLTSTLTSRCTSLSLVPQMRNTTLTKLLQSQRFVALQSISQSQEDGVDMFLLSMVLG